MVGAPVLVAMAEIECLRGLALLTCLGIGSCVSVCAMDPVADISGMAHIMLPRAFTDRPESRPGKFADTGIPELIEKMEQLGADRGRILVAVAGGARVRVLEGTSTHLDIGSRNAQAVLQVLSELGLSCIAHDLGGNMGRTVTFASDSGKVMVRTISHGEEVLCNFRG